MTTTKRTTPATVAQLTEALDATLKARAIASKFRALRGPHLGRRTAVPRHASPFRPT